jgi:hypothetical protein
VTWEKVGALLINLLIEVIPTPSCYYVVMFFVLEWPKCFLEVIITPFHVLSILVTLAPFPYFKKCFQKPQLRTLVICFLLLSPINAHKVITPLSLYGPL